MNAAKKFLSHKSQINLWYLENETLEHRSTETYKPYYIGRKLTPFCDEMIAKLEGLP